MNRQWSKLCAVVCTLVVCAHFSFAQVLRKPELQFTAPCASASFNAFQVRFKWDPPLVNSGNQFIIELSAPDGTWGNPTTLSTVTDRNTNFDFYFNFGFPSNTAGDNYKIRVRSTDPARTSPESDVFPAYYQNVTQGLVINNFVGEINVCDGSSATLSVDNFPNEPSYNWYRNGTLLTGENGSSLTTSQAGFYYVEVDYGLYCSGSTLSNQVEVKTGAAQGVAIQGTYPKALCVGETHTLQSNITNGTFSYQWYKNNVAISGANASSYIINTTIDTNFEGSYTIEVEQPGGCKEQSAPVSITRSADFTVNITTPNTLVLMPASSKIIGVTTNANNPTYKWFRNNIEITGSNNSTLLVLQPGTYYAEVTQGGTCSSTKQSENILVEVPNSFNITIAAGANYTDCSIESTTLSVQQIIANTTASGAIDVTADLIDDFSYQWLRAGVTINGETNNSLNISSAIENNSYRVDAVLGAYNVTSTSVEVKLVVPDDITISGSGTVTCDGGDDVTISTTSNNANYTYEWYHNGFKMPQTGNTLTTNLTGTYRLAVTAYGCTKYSNDFIVNPFDESLVSVDAQENIVFVEGGSRTVTASGADNYAWYNTTNDVISNANTVTFTEEGSYILRAFIGSCEITKTFTVSYQDNFAVPNVITPNGDGINDQWVIPNTYSYNQEVEVQIYDPSGAPIFSAKGYQNNWPQASLAFPSGKPPVFYYKIVKGKSVLKQGTITLIR